jgi:hypothetical protein
MGYRKKELAPSDNRQTGGATVTPIIPALQPITTQRITTVIVGTGQKEISDLLARIRPEFSHLSNGNGRRETILARLHQKFCLLDVLIERHTEERLGAATMEAVEKERRRYSEVLKRQAVA